MLLKELFENLRSEYAANAALASTNSNPTSWGVYNSQD